MGAPGRGLPPSRSALADRPRLPLPDQLRRLNDSWLPQATEKMKRKGGIRNREVSRPDNPHAIANVPIGFVTLKSHATAEEVMRRPGQAKAL